MNMKTEAELLAQFYSKYYSRNLEDWPETYSPLSGEMTREDWITAVILVIMILGLIDMAFNWPRWVD